MHRYAPISEDMLMTSSPIQHVVVVAASSAQQQSADEKCRGEREEKRKQVNNSTNYSSELWHQETEEH